MVYEYEKQTEGIIEQAMKGIKLSFVQKNRSEIEVLKQITIRDISAKYKGSKLGIVWTVINPVIMLSVYTIVFSEVFQAKWGATGTGYGEVDKAAFALNLFCGLTVFNIFGESIGRAPTLVINNPNYVKKIRFPLEALGEMTVLSSLFNGVSNLIVICIAVVITTGKLHLGIVFIPIIWLPLILVCLGATWIVSVGGVYIRDMSQIINAAISCMLFLSPVFYPTDALPEKMRWLAQINPIAITIEHTRNVVLEGRLPSLHVIVGMILLGLAWCELCYAILKNRQGQISDRL